MRKKMTGLYSLFFFVLYLYLNHLINYIKNIRVDFIEVCKKYDEIEYISNFLADFKVENLYLHCVHKIILLISILLLMKFFSDLRISKAKKVKGSGGKAKSE